MKMLYNKSIVSMLAISMLVTPSFVFAAGTSTEAGRKEETNFCTQIDTVATKIRGQLSNKDQKIGVKEKSRIVKLSEKRTSRDEVRLANRKEIDVKKDDVIKKLTEKADTDAKKVAVTNFQASIKTAVATRQAAVDNSVKLYRKGVDDLVNGKFASLDNRVVTLNKEIEASITTAKSSCTSGTKGAIVRRVMQESIKAAHEKMKAVTLDTEIKAQLKSLLDIRNAAIKVAGEKFKTDTEAARSTLKIAFGIK